MQAIAPYQTTHKVRIVTAASLFDGHDASINIMRRILQASGAEVIHLGHNRSVQEIVTCAIQEDVQAIAITSYQGGHIEYLKYMYDLLTQAGANHIRIFAGGGGTILPHEITELHSYGITRIYSPDDGRNMGLQGMINDVLQKSDYQITTSLNGELKKLSAKNDRDLARLITLIENEQIDPNSFSEIQQLASQQKIPVLGITGTGGAGKSSLTDELVRRFLNFTPDKTVAILSIDPSKRKTGGALLGDRIRMNAINSSRVFMRSMATRQAHFSVNKAVRDVVALFKAAQFDLIIIETAGIGQSDSQITEVADVFLYVMTPEFGASTQLEKIDMLDFADIVAINKFDKRGADDALRDVKKQIQRNQQRFFEPVESMPAIGTMANQFNDPGTTQLFLEVMNVIFKKTSLNLLSENANVPEISKLPSKKQIIPSERVRYLAEIVEDGQRYNQYAHKQAAVARTLFQLHGTIELLKKQKTQNQVIEAIQQLYHQQEDQLDSQAQKIISNWENKWDSFRQPYFSYYVRGKEIRVSNYTESLSHLKIPKIALPNFQDWGEIVRWSMLENVPGEFPFTAGVYPYKRTNEDPIRMFAGEGNPERTNKRFHYLSVGMPAIRLSTAFDSVTLYGENPAHRPDIYGKIGNSGVSIACLDDAKKLYSGFDLCDPKTSVSMTINGPAPIVLAFFLNAAIDQQCEIYIRENGLEAEVDAKIRTMYAQKNAPRPQYHGELPPTNNSLGLMLLGVTGDQVLPPEVYKDIKNKTLQSVRGTVQADILKEDQAQNTCIFSTEFALKLMGDIQEYFIGNQVRNFYSVSISGYHIAEAGANPISQVAFTIANGFTFVEYYLARGMHIDDFAPNLSFFFSNGIDPEYSVIGRVARRIWAKAIRLKYGGNERSQMLKYHIQTSGRSLHAQEIDFNDIRTTLQALYAIYDNCNSLHTNAYDEAITTPTEESVRRAVAIQLIINRELGLAKNENPLQGSFIIEELTDLVEEAIYAEFKRISDRGGVLGAMETMYQRNKIQEESLYYETLKHTGEYPIVGVNTFLSTEGSPTRIPEEVIRSTDEEKKLQIDNIQSLQKRNLNEIALVIKQLQEIAFKNENIFEVMMEAAKVASLGELSNALYQVGGQYRRNM